MDTPLVVLFKNQEVSSILDSDHPRASVGIAARKILANEGFSKEGQKICTKYGGERYNGDTDPRGIIVLHNIFIINLLCVLSASNPALKQASLIPHPHGTPAGKENPQKTSFPVLTATQRCADHG